MPPPSSYATNEAWSPCGSKATIRSIFPDYGPRVCQRSGHFIEERPEIFFPPAYVAHRGWIGARLDPGLDFDELADRLDDAYRLVAPRSLVQTLDQTEIR